MGYRKSNDSSRSYVNAVNGASPVVNPGSLISASPALVLDDNCIVEKDFSKHAMGRVIDASSIPNLQVILYDEGFTDVKLKYLEGLWVLLEFEKEEIKKNLMAHIGVNSWFQTIQEVPLDFLSDECIAWVDIEGVPLNAWTSDTFSKIASPALVLDENCIVEKDFSKHAMGRVIDASSIPNLQENVSSSDDESVHGEKPNDNMSFSSEEEEEDPFHIYDILNKKKSDEIPHGSCPSLSHPPGFTPDNLVSEKGSLQNIEDGHGSMVNECSSQNIAQDVNFSQQVQMEGSNDSRRNIAGSKGLGNKTKKEWIKELSSKSNLNFLAIQETKLEKISQMDVKFMWGNSNFDFVYSESLGFFGGILCIWEKDFFKKDFVTVSDNFIAVYGTWIPSNTKFLFISIYAPQQTSLKRELWDYLLVLLGRWNGEVVLMGEFNEGASFTWSHPSTTKMSKLDRFLISKGVVSLFPSISGSCLDRHLSDHRPILLHEVRVDFGPTPFRFYHSWFNYDGFDNMVDQTWRSFSHSDRNGMIRFKKKLQDLKSSIRNWIKVKRLDLNSSKKSILDELSDIDKEVDCGQVAEPRLARRQDLTRQLHDIRSIEVVDVFHKSKIKWAIEGDENTKFFHGIINKRRSQLSIRGIFVDGLWKTDLTAINEAFLDHFTTQFRKPMGVGPKIIFSFPKRLSSDQVSDLESNISRDEIRKAVWNCGDNKSPGTFYFAKASILVNGSPTNEFQFHCGLKQGDPLAPLLFILVMESLHLSFNRVVDAAFRCGVHTSDVSLAAASIGCLIMNNQFRYLGVMVGENMARHKAWSNVTLKLISHLSKWKTKTLSVGGRLTFLKSVLGASPLFYMSIFKTPKGNGNSTNFWLDIWKGDSTFCELFPRVYALESVKDISVASKMAMQMDSSFRRPACGGIELSQLNDLISFTDMVSLSSVPDRWVCNVAGNGNFSVKIIRNLIDDLILPSSVVSTRWVKSVPIKINIFMWRARRDCLPTRLNLSHRGVVMEMVNCPTCGNCEEDVQHIFFDVIWPVMFSEVYADGGSWIGIFGRLFQAGIHGSLLLVLGQI
uniref:RNA-directed DNA polymerase, eukaryota n=1 Tax=Tanacetum cinerariifolium TaxID=118510 RepID=A0A6L2JB63_TANCI|nr:RNA-directed DNA polymerase, eukaryota [Tanacetum cinerariifolium]